MTALYDVAVVGGGIAGAAASLALAQAGLSVVWVRPSQHADAYKVGESLAPAANPILSTLGLSGLLDGTSHRKANTTFSAWGQPMLVERNSVVHLEGAGHIIDRAKFEWDLNKLGNEACSIVLEAMLEDITVNNACWQLKAGGKECQARFIIDASGRSQVVGKFLAKQQQVSIETDDHLVAAYAFIKQEPNSDVIPTPATLIESVPNGWWYASLLPSNALALNYYSDPDLMPKGLNSDLEAWKALIRETEHIAYWLEDAEFVLDQAPQLASAATRWLSSAAGVYQQAGWAAIGDAAVAFDPLSAHGMTTALWAAARTPDLVSSFLKQDISPLQQYADAVAQGKHNYLNQRNSIYSQEKRFQAQPFWQRRFRAECQFP